MPDQDPPFPLPGSTLAHYRILELLGVGGQASVYRAHDTRLDRDVALKVPLEEHQNNPTFRLRLRNEARLASQLSHPNICVIYEVGEADGILYIAMELIQGETLKDLIPPRGLPTADVLRYGSQVADALDHAHEHGVIHRDIKSVNIMVARGGRTKMMDFGIAKQTLRSGEIPTTTVTEQGTIVCTLHAAAPEVLSGRKPANAASDVWSLGVMLYEMACGHLPFEGRDPIPLAEAIQHRQPDPLPTKLPARLRTLILARCLEKNPDRRKITASEIHLELEALRLITPSPRKWLVLAAALVSLIGGFLIVAWIAGWPPFPPHTPGAPPHKALAVLPLENFSGDPSQGFFADGVTEELIGNLGQIGNLRVISRNSVMKYQHTRQSLGQIAKELGVDLLVTGSVQPGQDSVRIQAKLFQGNPEHELWSGVYTREARQVLAMQSEVAQDIAHKISVKITPAEQARMHGARPVNPEAYEEYLRGRFFWNQRKADGMRKAIACFERAIAIDPDFALAYAGLADVYSRLSIYTGLPPTQTYPAARKAAEAALHLDDGLAEAHSSLAGIRLFYDRDWSGAGKEFQRAIELQPNYATAHHWYSIYLRDFGRFDEAVVEAERALERDPYSPIVRVNLADTYYYKGQFVDAIAGHKAVIATDSSFAPAYLYLGMAYAQSGQPALAVASVRRAHELNGNGWYALGALGYAEARAGDPAAARGTRKELVAFADSGLAVAFDLALIHVGLGENKEALDWLEKADDERAPLNELAVDPRFDPLRKEPRFLHLLDHLGLPRSVDKQPKATAQNRK